MPSGFMPRDSMPRNYHFRHCEHCSQCSDLAISAVSGIANTVAISAILAIATATIILVNTIITVTAATQLFYPVRLLIGKSQKFISARFPPGPPDQHVLAHLALFAYINSFPPN